MQQRTKRKVSGEHVFRSQARQTAIVPYSGRFLTQEPLAGAQEQIVRDFELLQRVRAALPTPNGIEGEPLFAGHFCVHFVESVESYVEDAGVNLIACNFRPGGNSLEDEWREAVSAASIEMDAGILPALRAAITVDFSKGEKRAMSKASIPVEDVTQSLRNVLDFFEGSRGEAITWLAARSFERGMQELGIGERETSEALRAFLQLPPKQLPDSFGFGSGVNDWEDFY